MKWESAINKNTKATDIKEKQLLDILAAFVKCARHVRNFPHPELTLRQLRREATEAETLLQINVSVKEWDKINQLAFKD